MMELLFILFCVTFGSIIWQLRKQSEYAKKIIDKHCFELDLQLLSISRSKFNFKFGKNFLQASFVFEFSSNNENSYQGFVYMQGLGYPRFVLPAYATVMDHNNFH